VGAPAVPDIHPVQWVKAVTPITPHLLVCIHGLGCTHRSWDGLKAAFDAPGWTVFAPDLPGFGGQTAPAGFGFAMEEQAAWLAEQLKGFSYRRLHIVAHSMGGAVGLLLPDAVLGRASSFVSVEGNLVGEDCGLVSRRTSEMAFAQFRDRFYPRLKRGWGDLGMQGIDLEAVAPEVFYRSCHSLVEWSDSGRLLGRFRALTCRRHYLYGSRNTHLPVLQRLPPAEKSAIADAGHFMMEDNPAAFNAWLKGFLAVE